MKTLLNAKLTEKIIELHEAGYTQDFSLSLDHESFCLETLKCFFLSELEVMVVGHGYDLLSGSYKYIHTVNALTGERGLYISEVIVIRHPANIPSNEVSKPFDSIVQFFKTVFD